MDSVLNEIVKKIGIGIKYQNYNEIHYSGIAKIDFDYIFNIIKQSDCVYRLFYEEVNSLFNFTFIRYDRKVVIDYTYGEVNIWKFDKINRESLNFINSLEGIYE